MNPFLAGPQKRGPPYKHVCPWGREATLFQNWSDSRYSVLSGCCPFKLIHASGYSVDSWRFAYCVERSLAVGGNWNPEMSPQAVKESHKCRYIVLWMRFWPITSHHKRQVDSFVCVCVKRHHIITVSRCGSYSGASCLSLLRTDTVTLVGASTKNQYRQTSGGYYST